MQLRVQVQELHTLEVTSWERVAQIKAHAASLEGYALEDEVVLSAAACKVRGQTPKVAKQEKTKKTGQAKQLMQYNGCFVNTAPTFGKKKGPNNSINLLNFRKTFARNSAQCL
uniref:Uncharacterized protein n=1 Tax=Oryctolagus cuniculus TaxID=9986 RepID=A0A5F9DL84_RABIT